MRWYPRPWSVVLVVMVVLAACSSGDGESSTPDDTSAPTSAPTDQVPTTPTEASSTDAPTDAQVREQALDVLSGIAGQVDFDPAEEECIVDSVLTDDDLRGAVAEEAGLGDLPAEARTKAIDAVVGCAPRSVARAAIGAIGIDIDETRRTCIEDGFAAEPALLGDLAETALSLDGGASVDGVPSDLILDVLGLLQDCGVSLADLSA